LPRRFLPVTVILGSGALAAAVAWWGLAARSASKAAGAARPYDDAAGSGARPGERQVFVERAAAAGFGHVHHKPQLDAKLSPIMPWVASVGAAAAAADFDGDGWMDLYVTDSGETQPNHLYRNRGDGTFEDVAVRAGVAAVNDTDGTSMDCVWGDYDNDGDPDLFVVKWGRDRLFRNDGGVFTDATRAAFRDEKGRPGSPWANGCAAIWFDYDCDGHLDIYVGNYFAPRDLWHLEDTRIMHDSFEHSRNAGRNFFWHNRGDGTFEEVAARLGVDDTGWTLSVAHGDADNDGWPDLYSANDFGPDQLFLNDGRGGFRNVSKEALGYDTKKGMNAEFGDCDNDGWLDIYVTNITTAEYLQEGNMLWRNVGLDAATGVPTFVDIAAEAGAWDGGWGWGAKFFDFDHDADLDIVALNGFITAGAGSYWYDLASWTVTGQDVTDARNWPPIGDRSFSGNEMTRLWRNEGHDLFTEIAARSGLDDRHDGRGVCLFDADNDGDLDIYLANQGAPPAFYRNDAPPAGSHWLQVELRGRPASGSNRDAVGARLTAVTRSGRQVREKDGGNSYSAQSDRRVHFGLGPHAVVDTLEIRWPSRCVTRLVGLPADQLVRLEEAADLDSVALCIPRRHAAPVAPPRPAADAAAPGVDPAARDAFLADIETHVRARTDDVALASRYRAECVRAGAHERAARFFEALVRERPDDRWARLHLATAYVDQIPTCGGVAAIVSKGTLARKSLDQLDAVLEKDPAWWPALYARGTNHLHWPRSLRHSAAAAADFRRLLDLQGRDAGGRRGYWVRSYLGLGDALAKDGDFQAARAVWQEGLVAFPNDAGLQQRLALGSAAEARAFVENNRSIHQPIDTDLSFLAIP
jgi:tetratricopeptide (TPR) repeat protein